MSVRGNYHEIALFLQEVASLPRIVHVSEIRLTGQTTARGEKVWLSSDFLATTYRFSDAAQAQKGTP
jgi:type IV pilus assembly protein PilO